MCSWFVYEEFIRVVHLNDSVFIYSSERRLCSVFTLASSSSSPTSSSSVPSTPASKYETKTFANHVVPLVDKRHYYMFSASLMALTLPYLMLSLLSVSKLFPAALQTVTKKIVRSRANSTLVAIFTILLLYISSFANMVWTVLILMLFCIMKYLFPDYFKYYYTLL